MVYLYYMSEFLLDLLPDVQEYQPLLKGQLLPSYYRIQILEQSKHDPSVVEKHFAEGVDPASLTEAEYEQHKFAVVFEQGRDNWHKAITLAAGNAATPQDYNKYQKKSADGNNIRPIKIAEKSWDEAMLRNCYPAAFEAVADHEPRLLGAAINFVSTHHREAPLCAKKVAHLHIDAMIRSLKYEAVEPGLPLTRKFIDEVLAGNDIEEDAGSEARRILAEAMKTEYAKNENAVTGRGPKQYEPGGGLFDVRPFNVSDLDGYRNLEIELMKREGSMNMEGTTTQLLKKSIDMLESVIHCAALDGSKGPTNIAVMIMKHFKSSRDQHGSLRPGNVIDAANRLTKHLRATPALKGLQLLNTKGEYGEESLDDMPRAIDRILYCALLRVYTDPQTLAQYKSAGHCARKCAAMGIMGSNVPFLSDEDILVRYWGSDPEVLAKLIDGPHDGEIGLHRRYIELTEPDRLK